MTNLTISSEEDALAVLQRFFNNEIDSASPLDVTFEGWPVITMRLHGENFNQTITPTVMKGFIELQSAIYKSVAIERYGPGGRLTTKEREELEIKVKVGKGSSIYDIDLQSVVTALIHKAVPTMDPTTAAITVIGLGLIWAGGSAWKNYLEHRRIVRSEEIKSESERVHLESMQFMSQEETKRMELLTKLMAKVPAVDNASQITDDARVSLLKSFRSADESTIGDIDLDSEVTNSLVQNARRKSIEIRLDGTYRVIKNDITDPSAFKVRLRNTVNKSEIEARVQDDSVNDALKTAIQLAEWNREPIALRVNAKSLDGEIKNAVVIGLIEPEEVTSK